LQVESLEARVLLSVSPDTVSPNAVATPATSPEATPTYERYVPLGVGPAGTAGPTGLTATQLRTAYGINQISFDGGAVQGTGAGQTIAIIDAYDYPTASSDLHNFDVAMGLPDPSFERVSQTGSTTSLPSTDPAGAGSGDDWEVEEALDIEWAHAAAPDANIMLVEANSASSSDLLTAVNYARQQPGVSVVSMSWGSGEYSTEASSDSDFTTPTGHAGVTFVASTGDDGAPGEWPAYSPNVLAVGGTTLTINDSTGAYVSETGWSGSGGGISSYESQPSYQKGVVTQSTTQRTIPDVSFDADPNSGVSVYDSYDNGSADPWETVGGTSLSAPSWAGLVAIVDQGRSVFGLSSLDGPTGTLPGIYKLPASDIHDITSGSNGTYSAGVGYDLVTGRGTPIANLLANDLVGTNQPPTINAVSNPAAILENAGAQTINLSGISPGPPSQNGETVTITATSSNTSLIPNPTVSYTNPSTTGTLSYTPVTDAYGSAVITLTVTNSGGTANGGVNTFTETFTVNVTQVNQPPTIAPISSPQTVVAGAGAQTINLTGISYGPAGNLGQTVTITAASSNPTLVANPTITYTSPNATGTLTYTPSTIATGSAVITVTVQNNGGTANGGSNTVTETFTIIVYPQNVLSTTTTLTALPLTITFGQSVALTATVSSTATPDEGIVTFTSGTTTLGTANVSNGVATLGVTSLPAGSPAVTAAYSDPLFNYADSTSPAVNVTVNQATPSVVASDGGGTYLGSGIAATATVNGAASLERVAPTITYYSGSTAGGSGSSTAPSHAGTYTVVASFAGSADYTSAQSSLATYVISPAPLTVTANNQTKVFGAALPTFTASYSGFVGSDTSASLTTQPTFSTTATATSPVSGNPYPITASGAVDPDYTFTYVAGSLTVTAAASSTSLTVSPTTVNYGQSVTLTATVSSVITPNEGTVTFTVGSTTLGTAPVSAGVATINTSSLPAGDDQVTASYSDTGGSYASSSNAGPTINTVAGSGSFGFSGDNGPATAAGFNSPRGMAFDAAGDLFIADGGDNRVREVNHITGVITTVAGNGTGGYSGDNGLATAAELNDPTSVAFDAAGDLFIAETGDNRIREVNHATGIITTVAGNGTGGYNGDTIAATAAELNEPDGVAIDAAGDIFIADQWNDRIREVNHVTGVITTVAGTGSGGFNGNNIQATAAELFFPEGIALDAAGDIFIADQWNDEIREVNHVTGIITAVAGTGSSGFTGDNGPATAAELNNPFGVALDAAGDIFIADHNNNRIREVNHATGVITTVAGNGSSGFTGDNGPATAAELNSPTEVVVDSAGDLLIADQSNQRVREVKGNVTINPITTTISATASPTSFVYGQTATLTATVSSTTTPNEGIVTFLNGGTSLGTAAVSAGVATLNTTGLSAGSDQVTAVYSDAGGEFGGSTGTAAPVTISQATPSLTVSGGGTYKGSAFAATGLINGAASLEGVSPTYTFYTGTTVGGSGSSTAPVQVGTYTVVASFAGSADYTSAQSSPVTFNITPAPLTITANNQTKAYGAALPTLTASYSGFVGSDSASSLTTQPTLSTTATATSPVAGNPYPITISGAADPDYTISYVAGSLTVTAVPTTISMTASPVAIGYGQSVTLTATVASTAAPSEGTVTFTSGTTTLGTAPVTAGVATLSVSSLTAGTDKLNASYVDSSGNFAASATGNIITVAGTGTAGFSGDNGQATATELDAPSGVAVDSAGNVYIADTSDNRVREINHLTGVITTVAGTGVAGYRGDNGQATAAELHTPDGLALDSAGNLYITDYFNSRIREVNHVTGVITTVAGNGSLGWSGDNGPATAAGLEFPKAIAIDSAGDIFIADWADQRIREVNGATGVITTIAGNGTSGSAGVGGPATAAELSYPEGVAVDSFGDVFIADIGRITEINQATKLISSVATTSTFYNPAGIALDAAGDLFVPDTSNNEIWELNHSTGQFSVVAGNGIQGYYGNNGPATAAEFNDPTAVAVDAVGDLFIADSGNNRVRELVAGATVTVSQATSTLSVSDPGGTYQGYAFAATGLINGAGSLEGVSPTYSYYNGSSVGGSGSSTAPVQVGTYTVVASFAGSADYTSAQSSPATFTITPAPLTITANNQTKVYGAALPTLTARYTGFVGSDTSASLTTKPTLATTATATSAVSGSPYPITISGAADPDYAISYVTGGLTITQAAPTVTVSDAGGTYTGSSLAAAATVAGVVSGVDSNPAESLESVTPSLIYYAGTSAAGIFLSGAPSTAGTYTVLASFAGSADYTSGTASTTFTISQAAPTVSVTDNGGTYTGLGFPATAASLEGVTLILTYYSGTTATGTALSFAPTTAGTYTVLASFAGSTDYASGTTSTTFTVGRATPTVSVTDNGGAYNSLAFMATDKVAGVGSQSTPSVSLEGVIPGLTYYSGTSASGTALSGAPSTAGTYTVLASFAGSTDYGPAQSSPATLTITPAPLTIAANNQTKVYGAALPSLTVSYVGFVGSDISANLTTQPTFSTTATATSPVSGSPYTITAGGAVDANYTIGYVSGSLAVTQATPTLAVTDAGGFYTGSPYPAADTVAGVVNGLDSTPSPSLESVTPSLAYYTGTSATGTALSGVPTTAGTYTVLASFAGSSDYTSGTASTTFTISPAAPTVNVTDNSGTYNGTAFAASDGVAGVNQVAEPSLEGVTPTLTYFSGTGATGTALSGAPSTAGTYTVVANFAGSTDYASTQTGPSTFIIGQAPLIVTANNQTMTQGAALPALTASYAGFVNGDTSDSLTTQPVLSTTATSTSPAAGSPYPITVSGAVDPDYAISYVPGTLVVVSPVHTPSVTDATTVQNSQTTSGLVITPSDQDAGIVNNFQITGIIGGQLFLNDGVTAVSDGQFISVAQGEAGLKFTPSADSSAPGSFTVQASTSATATGLGGSTVTATIAVTVNPPSSSVAALPLRTSLTSFPVSWSGTAGSGGPITTYDISVSIDGGAFTPWLTGTTLTSSTYAATLGHTYGFISQAHDTAGNIEPAHSTADTTITTTSAPWKNPGNPLDVLGTGGPIVPDDALVVIDYLNTHPATAVALPPTFTAGAYYLDVLGTGTVVPNDALQVINYLNNHSASVAVSPAVTNAAVTVGTISRAASVDVPVTVASNSSAKLNLPLPSQDGTPAMNPAVVAAGMIGQFDNGALNSDSAAFSAASPGQNAAVAAASPRSSQSPAKSLAAAASQAAFNRARAGAIDMLLSDPSANWLDA
jgi:sugar lactone lactonase YvrE